MMVSKTEISEKLLEHVSHELRAPLTAIKNSIYYMKIMGCEECSPKIADHMSLMNDRINYCVHIITNMHFYVEPEKIVKKEVKLDDIITDCLSQAIIPSNIKVNTHFEEDVPMLALDHFRIKIVFDNLIHNAVTAMQRGGQLDVIVRKVDKGVLIEFADTGSGIAPENIGRIFEPLFTTNPHCIGLGLAVSKQIVEDHAGTIKLESAKGKGTKVAIKLPLS